MLWASRRSKSSRTKSSSGGSPGEAAYTYAAGRPDTEAPCRPRTFTWRCRSCEQVVLDHGAVQGPAGDELGHAPRCARDAAAIAAWNAEAAQWEADWEAGQ